MYAREIGGGGGEMVRTTHRVDQSSPGLAENFKAHELNCPYLNCDDCHAMLTASIMIAQLFTSSINTISLWLAARVTQSSGVLTRPACGARERHCNEARAMRARRPKYSILLEQWFSKSSIDICIQCDNSACLILIVSIVITDCIILFFFLPNQTVPRHLFK